MGYTEEEYERVKALLLEHKGKGNEISSREINEQVELDTVGSFPQTRECVRDVMLRERIPIIGGGNGYYVAQEEQEVKDAIETLESRILNTTERKMLLQRAAQEWADDIETDDDLDIL
ncbi:hypothetical protein ACAH01_08760 [Halomicrobium sp. HM KBTZ05]|uniref:Uncharacterized protein n=1 Tax=Halomicrobium mukohataei TaxID=57705 RepID=A0A847U4T1_9EURY|nr:hypothetical protein [Halomicrobium mukohataei]NLV10693.1 hypothetical protein [Halomicrobium mukohataei]